MYPTYYEFNQVIQYKTEIGYDVYKYSKLLDHKVHERAGIF